MRILFDNAIQNAIFTECEEKNPFSNILTKDTEETAVFLSKTLASISFSNDDENKKINSFAFFNTNAVNMKVVIHGKNDNALYSVMLEKYSNVFCVKETAYTKIELSLFGNGKENIYAGFLIFSLALDFPPHSKAKTHKVNFTREQFFSKSGQYFTRRIPFEKYDEWNVTFATLTNKDKELILNFFEASKHESFILMVWKERDISRTKFNETDAVYGFGKYGKCKYGVVNTMKRDVVKIDKRPVFEMKAGLYVITNSALDFKKNEKSDVYLWSVQINFREVR